MLALGRALGRQPCLLLADELSLGLAPLIVDRLLTAVRSAADQGVGVLLVEQHVRRVLDVADGVYMMRRGRIEIAGRPRRCARRCPRSSVPISAGGHRGPMRRGPVQSRRGWARSPAPARSEPFPPPARASWGRPAR